jgi:hypothetical protein
MAGFSGGETMILLAAKEINLPNIDVDVVEMRAGGVVAVVVVIVITVLVFPVVRVEFAVVEKIKYCISYFVEIIFQLFAKMYTS